MVILGFCGTCDVNVSADRDEGRDFLAFFFQRIGDDKFSDDRDGAVSHFYHREASHYPCRESEERKSFVPHLYLVRAYCANATKAKHAKRYAPHLIL